MLWHKGEQQKITSISDLQTLINEENSSQSGYCKFKLRNHNSKHIQEGMTAMIAPTNKEVIKDNKVS